ncbi:MAG: pitrilysin family protein [Pseudomonadota bacterium]
MKYLLITFFLALNFFFLFTGPTFASEAEKIKKIEWAGPEIIWLPDERFPTYQIMVYFADGASSDALGKSGETSLMFDLLVAGTNRFSQKEISDNLEFYGVSWGARVGQEYSTYRISGLVKDIIPTLKQICHLFGDATFPSEELQKAQKNTKTDLINMVKNNEALAERASRRMVLQGTPYDRPNEGYLKDVMNIHRDDLEKKLKYFNTQVKKRIYITGPEKVLQLKEIFFEECGWRQTNGFVLSWDYKSPEIKGPRLIFVPIPKSTQAQVRFGQFIPKKEFPLYPQMTMTSTFLGEGFISQLMQEIRVKRGLSYGINAFANLQKDFGFTGISTFTQNSRLEELLATIKQKLSDLAAGQFPADQLERSRNYLIGGYPFLFERNEAHLGQLLYLDHLGKDYKQLYDFPDEIKKVTTPEVSQALGAYFNWEKMVVVVVGDPSLKATLEKFGKVETWRSTDLL